MANDLNNCNFIGRLAADPEVKYLPSGDPVTNFRLAVGWKAKDKEGVEWVSIVSFGKLAEICGQYLKKGSQCFISGKMRTRKWNAQDGSERYSTEIVADQMQMLGGKPESYAAQPQQRPSQAAPSPNVDDFDDDIPF
jgi:single-strand DNA-binding protein